MTDAINKLIDDNLWRDISEAPKDDSLVLVNSGYAHDAWQHVTAHLRNGRWMIACSHSIAKPTHFRPLPDDRCAKALRVATQNLEYIREEYIGMDGFKPGTAPEAYQQHVLRKMYEMAVDALQEITKIAVGKSDANER